MANEEKERNIRMTIIDAGFTYIWRALGYKEGELTLESDEGKELTYQMGILLQGGIEEHELKIKKQELLKEARDMIDWNRFVERNQYGP